MNLDVVWRVGTMMQGVEKGLVHDKPALKVRIGGKARILACVPVHRSAEPDSLMVRMDRVKRGIMLEESPELYYAPAHYQNYDAILVRLSRLTPETLHELLVGAYEFVAQGRAGLPKNLKRGQARRPSARN